MGKTNLRKKDISTLRIIISKFGDSIYSSLIETANLEIADINNFTGEAICKFHCESDLARIIRYPFFVSEMVTRNNN